MIVYDQLHWLKAPGVNAFLFEDVLVSEDEETADTSRFILVDTGMWGRPKILAYLQKLGHAPSALTHILVTHADIDHVGNLAAIQAATGATVIAGEMSAALLIKGHPPSHGDGMITNLAKRFGTYKPIPEEAIQVVKDGELLPLMGGTRVMSTPGHTPDHHSYHLPTRGIVFAGDAIWSMGGALTTPKQFANFDNDLVYQSALTLLDLTPVIFACGHGAPFVHEIEHVEALFESIRQEV